MPDRPPAADREQSRPTSGAASFLHRRSTLYLAVGLTVALFAGAGVLGTVLRGVPDGGQLSAVQTAAPSAPTTPPTGDLSTQREAGASLTATATATAAPTTGPLSWVAVIGPPYQEQVPADAFLAEVRASVPTAQRMPVTQLPQIGFVNGVVVVLPGFSTREQVTQFCTAVPPGLPPGCQPVATVAG